MKKFGLLGRNISYSFSPILHKNIFELYNIFAEYNIFDIEDENNIFDILNEIKLGKIHGLNVTVPYKTTVIKYLDSLSPEAESIGAVNCIVLENGKLKGYNTDFFGLIETFKMMNLNLFNKKVFILGSGGAAKAAFQSVNSLNGTPFIISRDYRKSHSLFDKNSVCSYEELKSKHGALLINATPVGTFPKIDVSPVGKDIIKNFDYILDLIYNPRETLFLKLAKNLKKKYENGLYMLVAQGIKSEEIWNNKTFNYDLIYKKFLSTLYNISEEFLK